MFCYGFSRFQVSFLVPECFLMGFQGSRLVFHGLRWVFMVLWFLWFFKVPGSFFMVPSGFLWFFKVPGSFFEVPGGF